MKKILLSIIILFTVTFFAKAQGTFEFYNGETLLGDTVLVYTDDIQDYELIFSPVIKNNTDVGRNIKVVRQTISAIDGTDNSFCWAGQCYPSYLDTSAASLFIPAGQMSPKGNFKGEYIHNEKSGITTVKYIFFDEDNPDIKDSIVVNYKYSPVGIINNETVNFALSDAYPNPAVSYVNFDYKLGNNVYKASITIVNLLGKIVKSENMVNQSGKLSFDISDLQQGIYFYTVNINGTTQQTKKLIIK